MGFLFVDVDDVFKALTDPTRRELLDELFRDDGQPLSALAARIAKTRVAVAKHLRRQLGHDRRKPIYVRVFVLYHEGVFRPSVRLGQPQIISALLAGFIAGFIWMAITVLAGGYAVAAIVGGGIAFVAGTALITYFITAAVSRHKALA